MTFIKRYRVLIVLLLIHVFVHKVWIFNTDYLSYGDARVYIPQVQTNLVSHATSIYNSYITLGGIELSGGTKLIELVHGLLAQQGIYYPISFRIIYLYPFVLLAPVLAYVLFSKIFKSEYAVLTACVVYLYNSYTLILQAAGVLMLVADMYILLLLIGYYRFYYEKKSIDNALIIILANFLISTYDFRIFYIACGISTLFVLHYFITIKKQINTFVYHFIFLLLPILLNAHWLYPLLTLGKITSNELFSRGLFGSSYFDMTSALLLFHRFWTLSKPAEFIRQPIPLQYWLIPIFVIYGLLQNRKYKMVSFFGVLSVVGIMLTKQEDIPLSFIYSWLYNHIPGFNAFREASKFYILTAIGYSGLIGFSIQAMMHSNLTKMYKLAGFISINFVFLLNTFPLINGKIGTLFIPRHMPSEYEKLNSFIINDSSTFRTLWMPISSKWGYYSKDKPSINGVDIENIIENPAIYPAYIRYKKPANSTVNLLRQNISNNLLDILGIKYVIIPMRDKENDDDFFKDYGNDREHYVDTIDQLPFLKKIDIGLQTISIYENDGYYPRIFLSPNKLELTKHIEQLPIEVISESNTSYRIKVSNLSKTAFLHFNDTHMPQWKLYSSTENSIINSTPNILGLNTFMIDPIKIKESFGTNDYTSNADGSINISLILRNDAQNKYISGFVISMTTLTIMVIIYISYKIYVRYVYK